MAARGQQRPWLTPPWEPLNCPDSGPPPHGRRVGSKGAKAESSGVPPPNNSDFSPARSLQLQPHARCSVSSGSDLRQPGAGSRGGPSQGPPPSTPPPQLARPGAVLESGAGFGSVSASGTGRAAGGGGVEGTRARAGGWRGVVGTRLRGKHFPGFLITRGTAREGAPGRPWESAPSCGAGALASWVRAVSNQSLFPF